MNQPSSPWPGKHRVARSLRRLRFVFDLVGLAAASGRARLAKHSLLWPAAIADDGRLPVKRPALSLQANAMPVAFPAEDSPQVSIVIPVYNHLEQTMHCLHALAVVGAADCRFEVVVVDDGSSDGSAAWLARCAHLRLHRMGQNSGFIDACNAGAAVARGEYLVFLNNDTEVTAGWLDALIATFDRVPRCGLVGAKLVYPDGSLQEAGGIVFADGNACNYGRGGDPADPRYNFVRETDYCSGACIALPTALFHSLGGFDRRYAPAYYEDTDLAFAVRAAGYQVIYQPRAMVVHFEGATAGTDVAAGVKRFQQVNRGKFAAKWQAALLEQPAADFARTPWHCATHRRDRHVLVVDVDFPHADRDSGSLRMLNVLSLLRELGCHVLFWAITATARDDDARMLEQMGIELVLAPSRRKALHWWYARGDELDIVMLSRLPVALDCIRSARRYATRAKVIFDTVDLHFLRIGRGAVLRGDGKAIAQAGRMRQSELGLMRQADLTLVVSEYEKNLLHELVPTVDVRVLSNIQPAHGRPSPFAARTGLLFLGNFEHEPNIDAVRWLIEEIMPRLRASRPGMKLHIVGYAGQEALAAYARDDILVHGHVADIEPILCNMKLALAPLRYGAGVKGKINMAMSHGVPTVTTSVGAEGMGLVHRHDAMIADEADGFADAIVELHDNERLWLSLSEQGLENVRMHFSPEIARRMLKEILAALAPG